jgi:transposase-like protein
VEQLTRWAHSTQRPAGQARRARLLLLVAQGVPVQGVAHAVGLTRQHVYKWVRRFQHEGVAGLHDRPPGTQTVAQRLRAHLRAAPARSLATGVLCQALPDVPAPVVRAILAQLARVGTLVRVRHGAYALPDPTGDAGRSHEDSGLRDEDAALSTQSSALPEETNSGC